MKKKNIILIQWLIPILLSLLFFTGGFLTKYIFYSQTNGKILETELKYINENLKEIKSNLRGLEIIVRETIH